MVSLNTDIIPVFISLTHCGLGSSAMTYSFTEEGHDPPPPPIITKLLSLTTPLKLEIRSANDAHTEIQRFEDFVRNVNDELLISI